MKDLRLLDEFRVPGHTAYGGHGDPDGGCFVFATTPARKMLRVVASVDRQRGWDHVSVSLSNRCPTWEEMATVKRLFFEADEVAMQLHMPPSKHINIHSYCLHLWRPLNVVIPLPPEILV